MTDEKIESSAFTYWAPDKPMKIADVYRAKGIFGWDQGNAWFE